MQNYGIKNIISISVALQFSKIFLLKAEDFFTVNSAGQSKRINKE